MQGPIEIKELKDQIKLLLEKHEQQMDFINKFIKNNPPKHQNLNELPSQPMSPPRNSRTNDLTARSLEHRFEENNNRSLKRQCDKETPEKLKRGGSSNP